MSAADDTQAKIDQLPEHATISRALLQDLKDATDSAGHLDDNVAFSALVTAVIRLESALQIVARGLA